MWPWPKRKVEARLSFTLYKVVMGAVGAEGAVSVEDVGAEECSHNPIQSFTNMNLIAVSRLGDPQAAQSEWLYVKKPFCSSPFYLSATSLLPGLVSPPTTHSSEPTLTGQWKRHSQISMQAVKQGKKESSAHTHTAYYNRMFPGS